MHGMPEGKGGVDVGDGEGWGERGGTETEGGGERLGSTVGTPTFGGASEGFVFDVS